MLHAALNPTVRSAIFIGTYLGSLPVASATKEGIAALLANLDDVEPLEFTPEEETEIAAAREEVRRVTIEAVRKKMGLDP